MKSYEVSSGKKKYIIRAKSESTLKKRIGKLGLALGIRYKEVA